MKRCCQFIFAAVLILGWAQTAAAAGRLVKDMVALDRIYIAALSLTGEENKLVAKKIIKQLETQWLTFKKCHLSDFREDRSAKVDFAEINQMIEDAARVTRLNGRLSEVHEILEGVRIIFLHLRNRNSIDYYLDYLTRFHISMETIMLIVKSKNAETLTGDNILAVKIQSSKAMQAWKEATKADFDRALFLFTLDRETKRKEYMENMTESLGRLRQALESDDRVAIVSAALSAQANFDKLYALFGDGDKIN